MIIKKNNMNSEEWLKMYNKEYNTDYTSLDCNWFMLDMYANFRNKELQNKIFQFRQILKDRSGYGMDEIGNLLIEFDNYFNIESKTKGQI